MARRQVARQKPNWTLEVLEDGAGVFAPRAQEGIPAVLVVGVVGRACWLRRVYWHIQVALQTTVDPAAPMSEEAKPCGRSPGGLGPVCQVHSKGPLQVEDETDLGSVEAVRWVLAVVSQWVLAAALHP